MAREVFGIVKRAGGRLGTAEPERSGMRADRTETLGSEPRDVESPEAAHRDPADRNPALVGLRPRERCRDRFAKHGRPPLSIAAVVPVAVIAAVDEQDVRRPVAEIVERVEERLPEIRVWRRASPVQEHE